ncbi:TrlF family AAA-like ATPase [Chlorobaculum sp. 24CR]|uniref:TrlF family AAA-like ATPase n=1 Tax=Chlorobaculum sp. 24CR TaxID=2508878 RepID=UPI001430AB90|nr:PHP-associated domain-containing protein [Chlorobaculum sp. 24CR]
MNEAWDFPGSRWWKFDFHTHTPRSNDYGRGDESLKNIDATDWLRSAMEAGLDCVVISDHNNGAGIDVLKEAYESLRTSESQPDWFRELTLFSGVEITVADSSSRVHLLAVFDPDCDSKKVTGVLGACGITEGYGDDNYTSTTTGFIDTVRNIREVKGIAIPAHVDGSKGLLQNVNSLTPELAKSLKEVFAAEFCDLHRFDDAEPLLKKAVKRLAKVAGSDAHTPDEIGRYYTWVKMSRPSIEGLSLALQDHEYCVKNQVENPNVLPDIFLSKLTITAMRHCGRISGKPFELSFHPHFNAVIGGRGTGKSTVLESIRIVTRRDRELEVGASRVKAELDRFMKLSQDKGVMESNTEILLEIHRRSMNYRLRWRYDGQGTVLEEEAGSDWPEVESGDLQERFPLSIYSQKQINELASNPKGLLDIIDRSPEVGRREWDSRWESHKSLFLQLRERKRQLLRQLSDEPNLRTKFRDVSNDLQQYEQKGHGEVLRQYQQRSSQLNGIPHNRIFDELARGIQELADGSIWPDFPVHLFDKQDALTAELKAIHAETAEGFEQIAISLRTLAEAVDRLKNERSEKLLSSEWYKAVQASKKAYESLEKEYAEKHSHLSLSLYGDWVRQRNQLQQQLNNLEALRRECNAVEQQIEVSLNDFQALRQELFEKRKRFLETVIGSNTLVRMELVPYGDVSDLESDYRSILNLGQNNFISSICDKESNQGILWDFCNWEELRVPEDNLSEIVSAIKQKTLEIAQGRNSGNHGAFDNRLKKLLEVQPAVFDQLDAWWPEDLLRVRYSRDPRSGRFDDLEKGSAGQKAAAILAFLLSHGTDPLIIDQPEDDLDNALIYDLVVRQIHENKQQRQLIIVTHNPNIVVNGDAELIHVLKFEGGQVNIGQQGGLEESNIRQSICDIMEGGKDAFDKRYRRITLEV